MTSLLLAAVLAGTAGCLQIDTKVRLSPDGSATVTERLNFSRRLLDLARQEKAEQGLETLLSRKAALRRIRYMGKGVTLVSHKIRDGERGSKESVTVYRAEDFTQLTYVSPFLARGGALYGLKFGLSPYFKYRYTGEWPGALIVSCRPVDLRPKTKGKTMPPDFQLPKGASPRDLQVYRELVPVFGDMLQEFKIRLRLETYCNIGNTAGIVHRHRSSGVDYADLIDFDHRHFDKYGYNILENEEIMVEILRWHLQNRKGSPQHAPFLTSHLKGQTGNTTLPVFHQGWGGGVRIRPSRDMFNRYFEGKTLDYGKRGGKQIADFNKIGWKPKGTKKQQSAKAQ
jgi:hypothetical protein